MSETQLREAYNLMKQGDKRGAGRLIQDVLKEDRSNVNAWWLFSHVLEDEEKVVKALEKVVALNPDHLGARKRLAQLRPEYAHLAATISQTVPLVKGKAGMANESKKINMSGLITAFIVFVVVFIISFLFPVIKNMMDADSLANIEGPPPEEVAMLQISAAFDGDYEGMRQYTCDSLEDEWVDLMDTMKADMSRGGLDFNDVKFDFSDINLEESENTGRRIVYSVTGEVVIAYMGQEISVDVLDATGFEEASMILVVNDNRWVVCSL